MGILRNYEIFSVIAILQLVCHFICTFKLQVVYDKTDIMTCTHSGYSYDGESRDLKTTTMADTIENTVDLGKTFFNISVNTDQIYMGFDADTQEK